MSRKQSQFIEIDEVPGGYELPVFGNGVNRSISIENFLNQIRNESVVKFIYPTIESLKASDLNPDLDNPIYVRVEETEFRLYKITNLAPGPNDIPLDNGSTATVQQEYSEIGFVVGPATSVDGAIPVFSGTTGTQLENGPIIGDIGHALIESDTVSDTSFIKINPDSSVIMRNTTQMQDDLGISNRIVGPLSSDNDQVALFDGETGKLLKAGQTLAQYFSSYLDAFLVTLYNVFPRKVNNFADLASTPAIAGQIIHLKEYHAGTGKGGGELIAKSGVSTPNNVTTFASATPGIYFERVNTRIEASHAGAFGNGVADDYAALQRYFTWSDSTGYVYNAASSGGSGFFGARNVLFSSRTDAYCISQPLVLGAYANFDFNHSVFLPHATFPAGGFAFDFYSYICRFSNLKLMGFRNGFRLFNDNLNATRVVFDNIDLNGTDVAFDIDLRSGLTSIKNSRLDNVNTFVKIRNGDMVVVEDCWLSATEMPENGRAHFEINSSHYPGLFVKNLLYVPWPQTKEGLSVVKVVGSATRVTIKDSHFGGEPGQIPIIKSYASGGDTGTRGCHLTLDNVMGYTTTSGGSGSGAIKPAVELHALPDTLNFINYFGLIEGAHSKNLVAYNPDSLSYAAALAAVPNSKIYINGHAPENYLGFAPGESETLAVLDCSQPELSRALFKSVMNSTTTGNTLFASGTAGRSNTYKVSLVSQSNSGADRYSEYIVSSNNGVAPLGVWTIAPIIEGSSPAAGRLVIDAGAVKVRGNSVTPVDILVIKQRITNIDPY